jgi:hypothetical protein
MPQNNISDAIAARGQFHHKRQFAYKLAGSPNATMEGPTNAVIEIDDSKMTASAVISTKLVDRGGDMMEPLGCQLQYYRGNPLVLLSHGSSKFLVGIAEVNGVMQVYPETNRVWSTCRFQQTTPDALDCFTLVKQNFIRATSIGFAPLTGEPRPQNADPEAMTVAGWHIKTWDLLEWSWLGGEPPMNPEALRLTSLGELAGKYVERGWINDRRPMSPVMRKMLTPMAAQKKGLVVGGWAPARATTGTATATARLQRRMLQIKHKRVKFYKEMDQAFDPQAEVEPSVLIYGWISKYLKCRIRDIDKRSEFIPNVRRGSFLTGLKKVMEEFQLDAERNFTSDGKETPSRRELIQLNSKLDADFLVDGMQFYKMGRDDTKRVVIEVEKTWGGLNLTFYDKRSDKEACMAVKIISDAWKWATENNFLKGEAFSLSGDFIKRTSEGWDDVFLEEKNKVAVRRVADQFNAKQLAFAPRGTIMTGPPGTGKTLASRIIRNTLKGAFIWVSAKDFMHYGGEDGMSYAFQLAKELAPSALCMEDCDAWLRDTTVDLIKTEMDGVSRSTAVWTIMTTNFPERLPDALIDRPGRFHEVLKFDFPSPQARREMLAKWLTGYPPAAIAQAVTQMAGYSGAHVYELAQFAKTLQESDGLTPEQAIQKALETIKEQRELIDQIQLEGANYNRRRKHVQKHVLDKRRRNNHYKIHKPIPVRTRKVTIMPTPTPTTQTPSIKHLESWTNLSLVTPKRLEEWISSTPARSEWPDVLKVKLQPRIEQMVTDGYRDQEAEAIAWQIHKALGTVTDTAGGSLEGATKPEESKAGGTDIQTVKLAKEKFPTEDDAKAYCAAQGFKTDKPAHEDTHWGYEQFPKEEMVEGSERKSEMSEGVHAICGTRKIGDAYESNKDEVPEEMAVEEIPEEIPSDESPRKASEIFIETLESLLAPVMDLLESAEATQDHQGLIDSAPQWNEAINAITSEAGMMKPDGKKADGEIDEDKEETDEERKKRYAFKSVWTTGKNAAGIKAELSETMRVLSIAYNAKSAGGVPVLAKAQRNEIAKQYNKLKKMGETSPAADPNLDTNAILAALSETSKKADANQAALTEMSGKMPTV